MTAIFLGFVLGIRHALDADHLVAITTMVSRERSLGSAARVGVWWGIGHSAMIFCVGGAIIAFRLAVPARLALAFEFCVALMLIVLGISNLFRSAAAPPTTEPRSIRMRPLLVGTVHGLAGSAAIALLVLTAIPGTVDGIVYLVLFGGGTVVGMIAVTTVIAAPALAAGRRLNAMQRYVRVGAGALSLTFGLLLAHEIGVERHLFGASPSWTSE